MSTDDGQRVEVDAAEVGAQPSRAAQPVRRGDVGEEGGVHDVDGHADGAGLGAAAVARCGVAELVDQRRHEQHAQQAEQQDRCRQRGRGGGGHGGSAGQPDVPGDDGCEREPRRRRGGTRAPGAARWRGSAVRDEGAAQSQGEQHVSAGRFGGEALGAGWAGGGDHSGRAGGPDGEVEDGPERASSRRGLRKRRRACSRGVGPAPRHPSGAGARRSGTAGRRRTACGRTPR